MTTVLPDVTLARLARDLDGTFPDLVTAHQDGIYSGVLRMVRSAEDAEDVTQDTFVRAYRALQGYGRDRIMALAVRPWLWTIALNLCRNAARARSRRPAQLPLEAAAEPQGTADTEAAALDTVTEREWARRLAALTPPMRSAVVLRHVVGLSYEEISAALGRPVGTVKTDVHRALKRLQGIIQSENNEVKP